MPAQTRHPAKGDRDMNGAISTRMEARDWTLLLLLSAIWGCSFFLISIGVQQFAVLTLVALRVGVAALVLWIFVLARGLSVPRDAGTWLSFAVMGLLNNILPFSLIAFAQTEVPSGLASILNATTPLFTVLVSAAVLADERANLTKLAGVVLGLFGVAVMMGLDQLAGRGHGLLHQLAVLGAAVCYALSGAYGRRFARMGVRPEVAAAGMVTASALMLTPVALATDGLPLQADAIHWLAAIALGVICTGLAYLLYFGILARAGATNISLVTFLVPVSAILLGWLFLGERLGPAHVLGMALIAAGLMLIDGRLLKWRK